MQFDKDIPIPPPLFRFGFSEMAVGDSTFIDREKSKSARASLAVCAKKNGFGFETRKEKTGIRIWRVS